MLLERLLLSRPTYGWDDPFTTTVPMQNHFRDVKSWPAAEFRYAILFTPRSGSSFLTDLIQSTGLLGDAGETFNPPITWDVAGAMGCTSLEDYVDSLVRARNTSGVFSTEVTWTHVDFLFRDPQQFVDLVQPESYVWLKREDYVAQAVSIMSMSQTGVSHTANASKDDIARARSMVRYNPVQLRGLVKRTLWMEMETERFFRDFGIEPLRLTYEQITGMAPSEVLRMLSDHLEYDVPIAHMPQSDHKKLSGSKSAEFADRFRAENKWLIRGLDRIRASF
ncbi:Stf0 family sulfotransferase [Tateyamaria sp. ANG-S1]|uniref:Stf0 family sulfotransferase n=1 Tax=Tateyamaria sp. ANG-S1 TaxID=1577905 RepID=UPI00057C8358|nr:Stf0 family sulfotransferase [Tateyamaria sp. ANG-S1]KIC50347.1 hypothetical protein RA29_06435 [Tateyamaria sp. ANG-S1]